MSVLILDSDYDELLKLRRKNHKNKKLKEKCKRLQQENERLKDSVDWWKDRFFGQQEYDDSHRITAIEYRKRIEKAIEYIEKAGLSNYEKELYNILVGSDNND